MGRLRLEETGRRSDTGAIVVRIDPRYFRPAEVETLLGDPTNAREKAGLDAHHHPGRTGQRDDRRRPGGSPQRGLPPSQRLPGGGEHANDGRCFASAPPQRQHLHCRCPRHGRQCHQPRADAQAAMAIQHTAERCSPPPVSNSICSMARPWTIG